MAVQSPNPVRTTQRRRQPTADDVAPRKTPPRPDSAAPAPDTPADRTEPAAATSATSASGWGGTAVLVVPTLGLLGVVAVVVAVNEVNQWWTLVFAMVFVVVATLCVVATIGRMLGGEDD